MGDVRILYLVTCRHCGERVTIGEADIDQALAETSVAEAGRRILRRRPTQRCSQCGVEGAYAESDLLLARVYTWQ